MKPLIPLLALILCLVTVLMGCHRSTTVILPPENKDTCATEAPSTAYTTLPTAASTTPSTAVPTTVPVTEPATVPATEPTAAPTTAPTLEPTAAPTTQPSTTPTAEPTSEPAAEPTQHPVYNISGHQIGALEYALLDAINSKRAEQELAPLTLDPTLCALGRIRAYECTESFTQTRPDGRSGYSVLTDYGYGIWSSFSQRLHYGTSGLSSGTVLKGWMYNPDFSADIFSPDFTHMGIGVYEQDGLSYIVCFFVQ